MKLQKKKELNKNIKLDSKIESSDSNFNNKSLN